MPSGIILCVDDDATVLNALRTLLSKSNTGSVVIEIAESGTEAMEICEDLHAAGQEPSVVITDFIMPGMRGDEFLLALHEISPRTVKIMLSGQSDLEGVKRTVNEANLFRFIEKPFSNHELMHAAQAALKSYHLQCALEKQNTDLKTRNTELKHLVAQTRAEVEQKKQLLPQFRASSAA